MSGCGTWGKITHTTVGRFTDKQGRIKQTIAVVPFSNRMPWVTGQLHTEFRTRLIQELQKEYPQIELVVPGDVRYPAELTPLFTDNQKLPDNITLAKICQDAGLNGVIACQLADVALDTAKGGVPLFRHLKTTALIQLEFSMYHAGTAAKLLDHTISMKVPLSEENLNRLKTDQVITASAMTEPLEDTAAATAKTINKRLSKVFWEGSIRSVSDGKVRFPFGQIAGFSVGDILEVRNKGDLIVTDTGSKYILPGLKVAEVKISFVSPYESEAVIIGSGRTVAIGDVVRFNRDN